MPIFFFHDHDVLDMAEIGFRVESFFFCGVMLFAHDRARGYHKKKNNKHLVRRLSKITSRLKEARFNKLEKNKICSFLFCCLK